MYIYTFGSVCRGEVDYFSDIDLLVIKSSGETLTGIDPNIYSIYSEERINQLWKEGNPFAWHLFLESRIVFSPNGKNFITELGEPQKYKKGKDDLMKFYKLFADSYESLTVSSDSRDFDLSMIFLAIRNFASCYALGFLNQKIFSRTSAMNILSDSIKISEKSFRLLMQARILSTRGIGENISVEDYNYISKEFKLISDWFQSILKKVTNE